MYEGKGDQVLAPLPDRGWERLPEALAELAPGPELAALLADIDRERLDGQDRVELMTATARMVAHYQARLLADMESIHRYETENPDNLEVLRDSDIDDLAASEIQVALSLTARSADTHLELALRLSRLPRVWDALHVGTIDLARARVLVEGTRHLEADEAAQVIDMVMPQAFERTTGQLRALLARLCLTIDPESAAKRYETGLADRKVVSHPTPTGTANLFATDLPAPLTNAVMRRINRIAKGLRRKGDPRTIDQIRADVLLDLLLGGEGSSGNKATVDIRVDLTTLMELDDRPGELGGFGPLIADVAREVVASQASSQHRITVTDGDEVVWSGVTRRRPTPRQRRWAETVDTTCVFIGCRMPATECDIDHRQARAEGGPTSTENLGPLCRRDHIRKHRGWRLVHLGDRTRVWTSPLGRVYPYRPMPP
jgi:hypothetical protein